MHTVVTAYFRTNAPAIPDPLAILTEYVDLNERRPAVKHLVESEVNVVKMAYRLTAFVRLVTLAIHSFNAMTSTNVRMEPVAKEQFA